MAAQVPLNFMIYKWLLVDPCYSQYIQTATVQQVAGPLVHPCRRKQLEGNFGSTAVQRLVLQKLLQSTCWASQLLRAFHRMQVYVSLPSSATDKVFVTRHTAWTMC
jgi:hypothetical protein